MFEMKILSSGVTLVVVPMRGMHSTSIGFWVRAGSRFESLKNAGVSHFIEHLVFKGTKSKGVRKIKEVIEGRGGTLNAFTSEELTCYYVRILREHLSVAIELLADLIYHPLLRSCDVDMERTVILEEIKMYKDLPQHHVHDALTEMIWPAHPLGRPILGNNTSITQMTQQAIVDYRKSFYHHGHVVISVSGDVTFDQVENLLSGLLPSQKRKPKRSFTPFILKQESPCIRFIEKESEQNHLVLGFHCPSRNDSRKYPLSLLHVMLGANMSSRLFDEVREKRGLAYDIRSSLTLFQDTGAFLVSAGVERRKAVATLRVVFRELKKIAEKGVSASELQRAKDFYWGQFLLMLESTTENMFWYGEKLVYDRKLSSIEEVRHRMESVGAADVTKVAREIFRPSRTNFALLGQVSASEAKEMETLVQKGI